MKVLINSTTSFVGGGVQVGASFVEYILSNKSSIDFKIAITKPIFDNLNSNLKENADIRVFEVSPSKILAGRKSRKRLLRIEQEFNPDLIYSMAFPSYVKFKNKEIGRYTNPWEIFSAKYAWNLLNKKQKILLYLKNHYRLRWAKKATYFETQTETAKKAILKKLKIESEKVLVSPNVLNKVFNSYNSSTDFYQIQKKEKLRFFCLSADHIHKNLTMIPNVVEKLLQHKISHNFEFILTLPAKSKTLKKIKKELTIKNHEKYVKNVGQLSLQNCLVWYKKSDFVFMPTLLEVFSATYLEAMKLEKLIITSDLEFSREICHNSAVFFKPNNPKDAALKIISIISNPELCNELILNGRKQLNSFPSSDEKHKKILDWMNVINER